MECKILVPSGIGDFSWTWSKLVTTDDTYHIEYIGGKPDRMSAFLKILPQDRILSFKANDNYYTKWNGPELVCVSRDTRRYPELYKARCYSDVQSGELVFLESNTFLEAGNRLESWLGKDIPTTDFHYVLAGADDQVVKDNTFVVNFSSYGTKKAWGYYDVPDSVELVKLICDATGLIPKFIGGTYDDYTRDICEELKKFKYYAIDLVGKTPDLRDVIRTLQRTNLYFGACSGLMVLSNVLNTAVCTYYPPFNTPPGRHLAGMWHDKNIAYMSLFWDGKEKDKVVLPDFLREAGLLK